LIVVTAVSVPLSHIKMTDPQPPHAAVAASAPAHPAHGYYKPQKGAAKASHHHGGYVAYRVVHSMFRHHYVMRAILRKL
jgi:hypothetical protein